MKNKDTMLMPTVFGVLAGVCFANLGWLLPSAFAWGGTAVGASLLFMVFGLIFLGLAVAAEVTE
jgi:Zn-dependent protease with chaperone function